MGVFIHIYIFISSKLILFLLFLLIIVLMTYMYIYMYITIIIIIDLSIPTRPGPKLIQTSRFFCFMTGLRGTSKNVMWEFPQTRGTFMEVPIIRTIIIFGYILGVP